jgi:outer membrane receptor protein involved in Fe transport
MRSLNRIVLTLVACALLAAPALAQVIPTGTLSGHVIDAKDPLPGVTVTLASPSLQGTRTVVTEVTGDYIFKFLPPGDYTVNFQLQGFQALETTIKISAAQDARLDATMPQARIAEQVTVVGSQETISTSIQNAATVTHELINSLPIQQNFVNFVTLAPGTSTTGPGGNVTISGAQSWENLMLVNGVSVQDNMRLTPTALFIEDAVQEATTQTSGISAEYGRFTGGVVNMLTKSGGNEMHGSFRLSLDTGSVVARDGSMRGGKWSTKEPLRTGFLADTINRTYMATLGGFILKDRLWYFLGGRTRSLQGSKTLYVNPLPYSTTNNQDRYEGKLTFALNPNHRFIGSYIKLAQTVGNNSYGYPMDFASLFDVKQPADLTTGNYTGVLSDNFFVEGQFSKKTQTTSGYGSRYTDPIKGTLLIDLSRGNSYRYWSPTFCGVCEDETRNNEDYIAKASYFLSTAALGTHDLAVGYDSFNDQRFAMNHQSGSDFRIRGTSTIIRGGVIYPQWLDSNTVIRWTPIFSDSKGTNFKTNSAFLNDKWRLNNRWSFNIGVRYDSNDGKNADGKLVAKDSNVSPRLGLSWDVNGDGEWQVNAGYARYVAAIANGVADATATGGQPGTIDFAYSGPEINTNPNAATLIDTTHALQILWDWFNLVGGTDMTKNPPISVAIPGGNVVIRNSLNSTSADEFTIGTTKRFGNRGMLRVDYVNRRFHNFYDTRIDMTTGQVTTPQGTFDLGTIVNNDNLERKYDALQAQFSFRPGDKWNVGGNYTLSRTYGNVEGENQTSGPINAGALAYPEYLRMSWAFPKGDLSTDQRHKARVWVVWDAISSNHNKLSVSMLQSYFSGTPYGAAGSISLLDASRHPYVTNPGYLTPPTYLDITATGNQYYFTSRDAFHTDNVSSTDLSFNYSFKMAALGIDVELFVEPRVNNIFNEKAVEVVNTSVYTSRNGGRGLVPFNPYTDTPVQCTSIDTSVAGGRCTQTGANWMKSTIFGTPQNAENYQAPRTFMLSFGLRF